MKINKLYNKIKKAKEKRKDDKELKKIADIVLKNIKHGGEKNV